MQMDFAVNILNALPFGPLTFMLLLPLVAAIIAYFVGGKGARVITLLVTFIELGLSLVLILGVDVGDILTGAGMQYLADFVMATIPVGTGGTVFQFSLGVDGLSVIMILLSNLVVFVAALSSNHINKSEGLYYSLFLLLQTGLMGVFMSLDLIGFFIFWELVLIPMFFIIGRWGEEGSQHASVKFFIYTHLGSAVMLVAFFMIYLVAGDATGTYTFSMIALRDSIPTLAPIIQIGFALAIFMGAGVKLPVFPLHNWLPWAHVKAPTPGSVVLAGILLKLGGYTFIRLGLWMIPDAFARLAIPFAALAIFTCIYAAFTAMAQTDLKSLVAYTSIMHMSFVLLGVAVGSVGIGLDPVLYPEIVAASNLAIQGAIFMMFSHGTIISVMFILAGQLKYSAGTRELPDIKGLMNKAPRLSAILILATFAAFGLPGFSGFIAEALIIFGSIVVFLWAGIITFGIFVTVGYMLWMLNRIVFSDPDPDPEKEVSEASWNDLIAPILMMIPVILLGIWPDLVLDFTQTVVNFILGGVGP